MRNEMASPRRVARPARKKAGGTAAERSIFLVCCILYHGASLSIPPIVAMGATGIIAISFIVSSPRATAIAKQCWPLYAMCAIAFLSALWSVDPSVTVRRSFQLLFSCLLGVAMVGRLGSGEAIKVAVRSMVVVCVLSVIWVVLFPDIAVHQSTDAWQSVHAGLWRGVLSHKVDLGIFAGLTLALVMFYGPKGTGDPATFVIGAVAAGACLLGSGSATGIVVAGVLFITMRLAAANAKQPLKIRKKLLRSLVLALAAWTGLTVSGLFDQMASMVGRSGDLTGRATYWPYVMDFLNSGNWVVGYGYGAGFRYVARLIQDEAELALGEAHNGYIEMLVAFGYVFGSIVIALHIYMFWQSARLQLVTPSRAAKVAAFPLGVMTVMLITSYIESILLAPAGVFAVLMPIVSGVCAEGAISEKMERRRRAILAGMRRKPEPDAISVVAITQAQTGDPRGQREDST